MVVIYKILSDYIRKSIDELSLIDLLLKNLNSLKNIGIKCLISKKDELKKKNKNLLLENNKLRKKVEFLDEVYLGMELINGIYDIKKEIKEKIESNIYMKIRSENIIRILSDLVSIKEINENQIVCKKISFFDYYSKIRNMIIKDGVYPLKNVNIYSKTLRELIDEHFSELYKLLLEPQITLIIGQTIPSYNYIINDNYKKVQKNNYSVRSYDVNMLSLLMKNIEIMMDYYGVQIYQMVNSKLIDDKTLLIYNKILVKLPKDIIKYIFEFSTNLPFLKFEKTLKNEESYSTKRTLKIISNGISQQQKNKFIY